MKEDEGTGGGGRKRVRGVDPVRDREDSIAFEMNYCQHYTPDTIFGRAHIKKTGLCAAVVEAMKTGGFKDRPCIGGHDMPNVMERCPKWLRRTREQGIERYEHFESAFKKLTVGLEVAASWRVKPKPRADRYEVLECPVCKGKLHLSQSSYNGHVHGKCETEQCVSWME